MTEQARTFGSAIDTILSALESFDDDGRRSILAFVHEHFKLAPTKSASVAKLPLAHQALGSAPAANEEKLVIPPPVVDIKALKEEKKPSSARQMACIVAYYLKECAEAENRTEIVTAKDIEEYFKQAGFKLPTRLEQLLIDCKAAGYFQSAARGEYRLTRVGYNLVAHSLPSRGGEG